MADGGLQKTLGLGGATALAVGIVVGAGMLALPGLVRAAAGDWATAAWLLDAALVVPLLAIFAWLGRRYPGAGGITGFVRAAFPWMGHSCGYLVLGTFSLGIVAIALTGAAYVWDSLGGLAELGREVGTTILAIAFLASAFTSAWLGARVADSLQRIVVTVLIGVLGAVAAGGFLAEGAVASIVPQTPTLASAEAVWTGMTIAFFAFTGWEMLAFTTGEFRNPERDFPLAIALSFLLVTAMYVGVSLAVTVGASGAATPEAALLGVVARWIGGAGTAALAFAVVAAGIIVVNLNGAVWAASRLVYAMGTEGALPAVLGAERLSGPGNATPRRALLVLAGIFAVVLLLHAGKVLDLQTLLRTAGQNFFILYVLATAAFVRLTDNYAYKASGVLATLVCVVFMGGWGWSLIYAALLLALPHAGAVFLPAGRRRQAETASGS